MGQDNAIRHLADLISRCSNRYSDVRVLSYPHYKTDQWKHIKGSEFAEQCRAAARGLAEWGLMPGDRIGIYSPNRQESLYVELGLFAMRGVSVPFYSTCSPDQVEYISKDANIKLLFVGEQYQYNNAYQVQREKGQIERIIIFDKRVVKQFSDNTSLYYDEFVRMGDSMRNDTIVKERRGECLSTDLSLIIYTSGTSGTPKGVTVNQHAMVEQINAHQRAYPDIQMGDVSANFLPTSHIFEKMWVYYCLSLGIRTAIITDPKRIQELLPQIKPTLMCNVPRYWEKVYQGVRTHIDKSSSIAKSFYNTALRIGKRYRLDYFNKGKRAPLWLSLQYHIYASTVFALLKRVLGLQRGRFFPTAGAKLDDEINIFLQSCGIPIIIGYGLSESCATVSSYPRRGYVIGSVGKISDLVQVRISEEDDEIQLKGEIITEGYYQNEAANQLAFTEDGWFRTGDAGWVEGDVLFFRERIKDLFKTANGKYIAPQQIERMLAGDPLIEQAACIGDGKKFASALIYPNWELLKPIAIEKGFINGDESIEELSSNSRIRHFLMSRIEVLQASLATFEKIKKIVLLQEPLSVEKEELTATLKIRRSVVYQHYANAIESIYREG